MEQTKSTHKLGSDLSEILEKRQQRSEATDEECALRFEQNIQNSNDLSKMLTRKEIKQYKQIFTRFDRDSDGFLDLGDLKLMMETLGAPQTHLSLKSMMEEVDTDGDSKISFNEFLVIFQKARAGDLAADSGLSALAEISTSVDITEVGIGGAKNFFEAKIEKLKSQSKFEEEIRKEQEVRRNEDLERKKKRQEFQQKHAFFEQVTLTN